MIRINKDLSAIPATLQPSPTSEKTTTEEHWDDVMSAHSWQKSKMYKQEDIKASLKASHNNKCAFCEKLLSDAWGQVEHFRPKAIYYWLGFSWDNLLWACGQCNGPKGDKFPVERARATYAGEAFAQIHGLSAGYDVIEGPLLFNPTLADPKPHLRFLDRGEISSEHRQLKETISVCKLNRDELLQNRYKILNDELIRRINPKFLRYEADPQPTNTSREQLKKEIADIIRFFCENIRNGEEYIAWRKYVLRCFPIFLHFGFKSRFDVIKEVILELRRDAELRGAFD